MSVTDEKLISDQVVVADSSAEQSPNESAASITTVVYVSTASDPTPPEHSRDLGLVVSQESEVSVPVVAPSPQVFLTSEDVAQFKAGSHGRLYEKLGSHLVTVGGEQGVYFAMWAPNAERVSVIGDFNGWNAAANPLTPRTDESGLWEGFFTGVQRGQLYKYSIVSRYNKYQVEKRDPFSVYCEIPPHRASRVWDLAFQWADDEWMRKRSTKNALNAPMSIYELHIGSWRRHPDNRFLSYTEMAAELVRYVKDMGFTHVEFMPLTAHPLYESWGYQTDGYFAPTARYGSPQELMFLIDQLHRNDVGVILDWVPSHFPCDKSGLTFFDGTYLFEHADPRKGFHPEWKSAIFNYGRNEVRDFLVSSALFWLEKYHIDGIRVDGGSSMLYLDYGRRNGGWIPNKFGGRENLEAIDFLKQLNERVGERFPDVQMILEEATPWPNVCKPTVKNGLGFGMKWNMGWMHDTLKYLGQHPSVRKHHQSKLTFSLWYAFSENFLLALSHDEVVHGKGSLIRKMPGDDWQKFANLRLLFGYMYGHPGKKLLFMGGEFGQWAEWNQHKALDWQLAGHPLHRGLQRWVQDLNRVYRENAPLHEVDFDAAGFEWVDFQDWQQSVLSFIRKGSNPNERILVVCNFSPTPRHAYRIGVPHDGFWQELLNSNAKEYGGEGLGNWGGKRAEAVRWHGREFSLSLTLPPLALTMFRWSGVAESPAVVPSAVVAKEGPSSEVSR